MAYPDLYITMATKETVGIKGLVLVDLTASNDAVNIEDCSDQ